MSLPRPGPGETQPDPAKAAKTFAGSTPPRFAAAAYRTVITEKLDAGLSLQRVWQELVDEYSYGASYESVKRFVRTLTRRRTGSCERAWRPAGALRAARA